MEQLATTAPRFAEFERKVRDLRPLVREKADEAERLHRMSDDVVAAFKEADLYWILVPRALGGAELRWCEALKLVEATAYDDGSTGWCLMVGAIELGMGGAFLPEKGAKALFARGKDLLMAGQGPPRGTAVRVAGGYQIEGSWSYGSGIHHADVIHTGCLLLEDGKPVMSATGLPEVLICHVDRKDVEIFDNWDVIGLRGTGSFDYTIQDVFVPEEMTHLGEDREPVCGGIQYRVGLTGFTAWGHSGFALGVGRRVLDEIAELSKTKTGPFGRLADASSFQLAYARAEAKYRAARAFCYSMWTDVDESFARGEDVTIEQIALLRGAMTHLHEVVSEVCTFAHKAAGGASLRPSVIQRCFRDIHAATQHVHLSDTITQDVGRALLGAGEDAVWTIVGLKDQS